MTEKKQSPSTTFTAPEVLILVGVSLAWLIPIAILQTIDITRAGDLSSLLFGAASVALFLLSFLVALLGIFGWQNIQESIKDRVRLAVQDETRRMSKEISARHLNGLGFMIGELCHDWNDLKPTDKEKIQNAIEFCKSAFKTINEIESSDPVLPLLIQNNYVFYLTILHRREDERFILDKARDLRKKNESLGRLDFLLTYCRAVICFSSDPAEKEGVRNILEGLRSRHELSSVQRKEVDLYLKNI